MTKVGGYWREAATVMLVARNQSVSRHSQTGSSVRLKTSSETPCDFSVLMLKRSAKSKFMPERHVFPGGTLSEADFDSRWIKLFEQYTQRNFISIVEPFRKRNVIVPAFREQRNSAVPAEIAFRICAIRECFEECGVLLAKQIPAKASESPAPSSHGAPPFCPPRDHSALTSKQLNSHTWRKRVNRDAGEFLTLCLQHHLVPDLWALHEWTNWLTPVTAHLTEPPAKPRRFDTLFYVCCLDNRPGHVRVDGRETTVLKWESPAEFVAQHRARETVMSEPQIYELSRLAHFPSLARLREYCAEREIEGMVRYLPVIMVCQDGYLNILPGDELYPAQVDAQGTEEPVRSLEKTQQEMQAERGAVNRTYHSDGDCFIACNTPPICGLVAPQSHVGGFESKL